MFISVHTPASKRNKKFFIQNPSTLVIILQASYDDLVNYYYLEARTELGGSTEFRFALEPTPAPTVRPAGDGGDDSDGLSVGAIVGIVVGVLLLVVALVMLVLFLKKTKR